MCGICSTTGVNMLPVTTLLTAPDGGGPVVAALPPYPPGGFKQDIPDKSGFDFDAAKNKYGPPGAQLIPELSVTAKSSPWIPVLLFVLLVAVVAARE